MCLPPLPLLLPLLLLPLLLLPLLLLTMAVAAKAATVAGVEVGGGWWVMAEGVGVGWLRHARAHARTGRSWHRRQRWCWRGCRSRTGSR